MVDGIVFLISPSDNSYLLYINVNDFCGERKRERHPHSIIHEVNCMHFGIACVHLLDIYMYKDPFSLIARVIPEFHDGVSIILCFQNKQKLCNQLSLDAFSI